MRFTLPKDQGLLDVRLSQGQRKKDKHPILLLQLSAKGRSASPSWEHSREWFSLAHNWIVNGFAELTAADIQTKIWQKYDVTQ